MILWKVPLVYPWDINGAKPANNNKPRNTPGSALTKYRKKISVSYVYP